MDGKKKAVLILYAMLYLSFQGYGQDCNITSKANDILPDKLCAPVSVSWEVTYRGVNDGGTNVQILYDWDDGSSIELENASQTNIPLKEWRATLNHVYPIGGDKCNYRPKATLVVDGTVCSSSMQEQIVTVWDTDDLNGGEMAIDPLEFPICVGNDGTAYFTDNSQWNCTPPDENDAPNFPKRWIQWIYGTNDGAGNFIGDAEVDGVIRAYPYQGSIDVTFEPILGPSAPWNAALPIYVNNTRSVGEEFEITLRNWNFCNPYDDPNIPGPPTDAVNGDYDPVITTARVIIVDNPDGTINPAGPFCENSAAVNLTAVTPGGTWTGTGITDTSTGLFDPSVAGPGNHLIEYEVSSGAGCRATGSVWVEVWEAPVASISVGSPTYLCPGTLLPIDGNPSQGTTPYTHFWSGDVAPLDDVNRQDPTFQTLIEGTYQLTYKVTDGNGCFDDDVLDIVVDSVNVNFLNPNLFLCTGVTQQLEPDPQGGSGVFIEHRWSGDRTDLLSATDVENPDFLSMTSGLYKYEYYVRDSQGCENADSVYVQVYQQPIANPGSDDTACGLSYVMGAIPSAGNGIWQFMSGPGSVTITDDTNPSTQIVVDLYGDYLFKWKEVNNICSDSVEVTISFVQVPKPIVMEDTDTCGLHYTVMATQDVGVGIWRLDAGPGTALFGDELAAQSTVGVDEPGQYRFIWQEDNGGCLGSDTVTIDFYPIPLVSIAPFDQQGCNPVTTQFVNTSVNADSYFWDFGDGFISNQSDPLHTFTNGLPVPQDYEIQQVGFNSFGCRDTAFYDMKVFPNPLSKIGMDEGPGCSPLLVTFDNNSEGATLYEWDFGDGSTIDNNVNVSHSFVNDEIFVKAYEVSLKAENVYGCVDSSSVFVTVYPGSLYGFSVDPLTGCHPLEVQMLADPGAFSYKWDLGDGTIVTSSSALTHVYENITGAPVIFDVSLYTSSVFGCQDTSTTQLSVNPSAQSGFDYTPGTGCSPLDVVFTNQSSGATFYEWHFGDGSVVEATEDVVHTFVNNNGAEQNFEVMLVAGNGFGCNDTTRSVVTVYPAISFDFTTQPEMGCHPLQVEFQADAGASAYEWDFGDGHTFSGSNVITHLFENNSQIAIAYQVSLVTASMHGCTDTTRHEVVVNPSVIGSFDKNPGEGCSPLEVDFTNNSSGATFYEWHFGDGSVVEATEDAVHTFVNNTGAEQNFEVMLVAGNGFGCNDTTRSVVTVYPSISFDFTATPNIGCHPSRMEFQAEAGASAYEWDFGDGQTFSGSNIISHLFENSSTLAKAFDVQLITASMFGCKDTTIVPVTVNPSAVSNFNLSPVTGCSPMEVVMTNQSTGASFYKWDFGDGSVEETAEHTSHTYFNMESVVKVSDITLVAGNSVGCNDTIIKQVTVYPEITFDVSATPSEGCAPLSVEMETATGAFAYKWEFGDGSSMVGTNRVNHVYLNQTNNPIVFDLKLFTASAYGCLDTSMVQISVHPSPDAVFDISDTEGCSPLSIVFINQSTGGNSGTWYFGDGGSQEVSGADPVSYTYVNNGFAPEPFNPKLVIENSFGCVDSTIQLLRVLPQVIAKISEGGSGCSPYAESFINESSGASSFNWNFGDGNSSNAFNGRNEYVNKTDQDVLFPVELIASSNYGCTDTAFTAVRVYRTPIPDFDVNPKVLQMPESTISIDNTTSGSTWSYLWRFGDGNQSDLKEPGDYSYGKSGMFDIWLEVSGDECKDSVMTSIEILPMLPGIDYGPNEQGCPPLETQFYNNTLDATTFMWDFGDGNISSDKLPDHTYYTPGIYNVKLTAIGPGGVMEADNVVVEVYEVPVADFEVRPPKVKLPATVSFINKSEGGSSYLWDFGDGNTSIEFSVQYAYQTPGVYDVWLEVTNEKGCMNKRTIREAIIAEEAGEIEFPNAFTPNPNGSNGGQYIPGEKENYVFYPFVQEGVIEYKFQIFTRWGEIIFESNDVKIGWDGYYRGKLCAQGVYIWKVVCKFSNGKVETKTGDVTLFR
ncbi:MAG: PKD domain-containing protein [Marinilabiliaceae bacterium]|nr:PKD domain-containing protein [Marinilabiliaceae bacterium]